MSTTDDPRKESDADRLLDHDVDGIREYDNPMPRWWLWIFWVTIAWSVLYVLNVIPGVGSGRGRIANHEAELARAEATFGAARAAATSQAASVTPESIMALVDDASAMAAAKEKFAATCMPCHLADGGGSIGPNLTDDHWLHGAQPMDIHRVISQGVLDKGMPAWDSVLGPDDVRLLAAYVATLHGTHPATPKAPEGVKVEYEDGRPLPPGLEGEDAEEQ